MKYTISFFTKDRAHILAEAVRTIPCETPILVLSDASDSDYIQNYRDMLSKKDRILEIPMKSSCAKLWNHCIMHSDTRYILICNDDIKFSDKIWDKIDEDIKSGYEVVYYFQHGCFLVDKLIIPKIGWLDERFRVGTCEDVDYAIRVVQGNINKINRTSENLVEHLRDTRYDELFTGLKAQWWNPEINVQHFINKWALQPYMVPLGNDGAVKLIPKMMPDIDWHPRETELIIERWANE